VAVSDAVAELGGDVAYRLPTSLNEGRGKRGGLSMDGEVEGGAGDMVQWAGVGVSDERALAWPMWALARGSGDSGSGGCGLVVVRSRRVMVQCLAMGGCQTLQLLIIGRLIINKHFN
jgi:hypothetical protein